ncbi:MAG TPA: TetR/AcrR family transcriptional regulator [Ramlibacter sp.]|jgi:AcrR family transcriptional regulator|nr:TetR/AcrR family transcriptional regulator [Ramlibacter sp.]
MRYPASHKEETRKKLLASARAIAKKGGFGTTGVDELMAGIGLTGGAFYGHFPSKEALFAELVLEEVANSTEMLAGGDDAAPDHVAQRLRSYLSSYHALHPETGCALPTLGPEIARGDPEVKAAVEQGLKQLQKSWSSRIGNPDAAWALLAQCVGALVLARCVESERTRKDILASSRRFIDETHALDAPLAPAPAPAPAPASRRKRVAG